MSDPAIPTQRAKLSHPAESDAFHRLTSRLAILDLDPATLEMLTAVLNADMDGSSTNAEGTLEGRGREAA
jgi:hypothetical protein